MSKHLTEPCLIPTGPRATQLLVRSVLSFVTIASSQYCHSLQLRPYCPQHRIQYRPCSHVRSPLTAQSLSHRVRTQHSLNDSGLHLSKKTQLYTVCIKTKMGIHMKGNSEVVALNSSFVLLWYSPPKGDKILHFLKFHVHHCVLDNKSPTGI